MTRISIWILLTWTAFVPAQEKSATPKTVRLVTVGNSFSQNATRHLEGITKAAGHKLIHKPLAVGGASMALHAGKAEAHEADAKDPKGLYGMTSLKQELMAGDWDYVTIQQASFLSHNIENYRPYAKKLYDAIKKSAPKAEVLLHETWAYREDDPRFRSTTASKPGEPTTHKAMYDGLKSAYETIASELGVRIIPVGDAFYLADTDPKWGYKTDKTFDIKNAKAPALPDQTHSLHVGWRWTKAKDGKTTLGMDGHHANVAGEYLGGCVFFEVLFNESAVGNKFVPAGVDPAFASYLQEVAHRAVAARQKK